MSMPVRSLPVVQNWDCHGCTNCCRTYAVGVSAAEKERIEGQGWAADPDLVGTELVVPDRREGGFRLAHRADESCVFLRPDGGCRIHAKFGAAAKPLACRVYPFVMVPAGDHWRVGMRFACPSAVENKGRPMTAHAADVRKYADEVAADRGTPTDLPAPPLAPGQPVPWADAIRIAQALAKLMAADAPVERKLRRALALAAECRRSRFDAVSGSRLGEFLDVMSAVAVDDTPADPATVPPPGWAGRMVFRQVLALYARKDVGRDRGDMAKVGPLGRALAGWRFATGKGRVPRVHALLPADATFADAERPAGPLPAEGEELLSRYYRVKLESMQFCGRPNFGLPFWDGFDSLALTFPAVMWLARVLSAGGRSRADAVARAVRVVDDNFGFNPLFGRGKQRWAAWALATKGELPRLVAWYGQ